MECSACAGPLPLALKILKNILSRSCDGLNVGKNSFLILLLGGANACPLEFWLALETCWTNRLQQKCRSKISEAKSEEALSFGSPGTLSGSPEPAIWKVFYPESVVLEVMLQQTVSAQLSCPPIPTKAPDLSGACGPSRPARPLCEINRSPTEPCLNSWRMKSWDII